MKTILPIIALAILLTGCRALTSASLSDAQLEKRTSENLLYTRKSLAKYPDYYAQQIARIDAELKHRRSPNYPAPRK